MSRSHAALRTLRKLHLYLGVFTAPALLFFAFTGAMQTFSLHETTQGSNYKPPVWLASLAQLHKKETLDVPVRKLRPAGDGPRPDRPTGQSHDQALNPAAAKAPDAPPMKPNGHLPMKIFFLLVSIGLFLSTLTGIYMAYRYSRGKWLITGLLSAGFVIPILLLPF